MNVKISVIIPVYNVERYLPQCLDSVIGQTLRSLEIIAINDGSPDGSLAILKAYAQRDARIRIIDKQNEGVGRARNDGLRAAVGEFVAFLDSDDYYPNPQVLETLYTAAKTQGVLIAGGRKIRLYEDGSVRKDEASIAEHGLTFTANGRTAYADFQYDFGYTQYIMDRMMLVDNNISFPEYRRFQDPPFFVRAMIAAGTFYAADCESYCYRLLPGQQKYSMQSTVDFLRGVADNLKASRAAGLAKLHYLSAMRLAEEGSFLAIQNLYAPESRSMLAEMIRVMQAVDLDWLAENGYPLAEPFLPPVFEHLLTTAGKYEALRQHKALRVAKKLLGK